MLQGVKIDVVISDWKDLENFHGEGYFEIGLKVWASVQQGWEAVAKANEPESTDYRKQNIC